MKQAKKIFTRMCLNNWGGIDTKVLEFNEYVNLFSGKSGSGKSTVMDAIQVILYGSFSPNFLNRAADDSKNKRSVLSYLRGEQKDGSANREGEDFCAAIVLEIKDTGKGTYTCAGLACEIGKNDSEIRKYVFFSHAGKMPENHYIKDNGLPFTNKEIRDFVNARGAASEAREAAVCRVYSSREAYLGILYDQILGYIDGNRFTTMEKSAIALKMTNGTGQFIRDYMFPRASGETIEKISEQLGSYRSIREKIEDLRKRIELLDQVHVSGIEITKTKADILHAERMIQCIEIEDLLSKIEAGQEESGNLQKELDRLDHIRQELEENAADLDEQLIQVEADLNATDLGRKKEHLKELSDRSRLLSERSGQWINILTGLSKWSEDEVVTDYVSNALLNSIDELQSGSVSQEQIEALQAKLSDVREIIDGEYDDARTKLRETQNTLTDRQKMVDDIKNNRKPYSKDLQQARMLLEDKLKAAFDGSVHVHIFADLFEVTDEEWKNAIEGRLSKIRTSLITEPKYAHRAAVIFREMKQFEEVNLINSAAIRDSDPQPAEHSLYEAVSASDDYVNTCLKRYLGHIIKCRSVEELEQVHDGVTPDCYSYSNFIFRHLRSRDYINFACIGSRVSRTKLAEYEEECRQLQAQAAELENTTKRLKDARDFESLRTNDASYYASISGAGRQLKKVLAEKEDLEEVIRSLQEGQYHEIEEKKNRLTAEKNELQKKIHENQKLFNEKTGSKGRLDGEIESRQQVLAEKKIGYVTNEELEKEVKNERSKANGQTVRSRKQHEITLLDAKLQEEAEKLQSARYRYIKEFNPGDLSGAEKDNEKYDQLLQDYRQNYEPRYQSDFEHQCKVVYQSLRDNVIATIHGDIKAAKRHAQEINRMLRDTNFSDSMYQIRVEAARNENGQFYEMLMAPELDSKNINNEGFDGQLSFGDDSFYHKYEQKIQLLTEKFMPVQPGDDAKAVEQRRRDMEQYADYRNYLNFSMYEEVHDADGNVLRQNMVDDMAGRDSGGEGQNPKYVALLAGFAMLYMQQSNRDSRIRLVLLDEAFSKMDQERSAVCLKYARRLDLQLIVCVPDERLQSLIRNVDCVYGFRRYMNRISMMHIDKGDYLKMLEGDDADEGTSEVSDT